MHTFYLSLPFTYCNIHAEYPSVVRGNRFIDWFVDKDAFLLYFGRLHIVVDRPSHVRKKRVKAEENRKRFIDTLLA